MAKVKVVLRPEAKTCAILGGGHIADYASVAAVIGSGAFVICADSGYNHCAKLKISPDLLVGDLDSIGAVPDNVPVLRLDSDKDYTDTFIAAEEAVRLGYKNLILAGMTGGRLDHSIANIQMLVRLSRAGINACITDGITLATSFTAPLQGCETIIKNRGSCYFSVFAASDICRNVNIRGGKYPLVNYDLSPFDPRAVSNEFAGTDVHISLDTGTVIIIVTPKR